MTDLLTKVAALRETARAKKPLRDKPRHHAEAILLLPTREARKLALEQVPEEIRHIVKWYVVTHFAKLNKHPLPDFKGANNVSKINTNEGKKNES